MNNRGTYSKMMEQDKTPEEPSKVEIKNLPNKDIKVIIIKMLNEIGRIITMKSLENSWKPLENIMKNQIKLYIQ